MKPIMIPPLARLAAILFATALAVGGSSAHAEVATVRVEARTGTPAVSAEATIEAVRQSTLAAQMSGRVLELAADAGDRVGKGEVLVRIDPAEAAAAVAAAEAGIAQAQTALANARSEYARARSLVERKFLSQSALDGARTQFEAAEAQLQAARAQREQVATVRGYATVASPLDGLVAARHIEPGEMAQPGRALLTVYDPAQMRAVADLAPQRLAELGGGPLRASVELPASGRTIEAAAVIVLPAADARTHTVRVRVDLPAGTADVLPGSFARVHFQGAAAAASAGSGVSAAVSGAGPSGTATAAGAAGPIVIPAATVLRRGELTAVYAADGEGGFTLRQIRLGRTLPGDGAVEVLSGLKGDETLALDPVQAGIQARSAAAAR
jgi:RND family efflux transporter MFP subunit